MGVHERNTTAREKACTTAPVSLVGSLSGDSGRLIRLNHEINLLIGMKRMLYCSLQGGWKLKSEDIKRLGKRVIDERQD